MTVMLSLPLGSLPSSFLGQQEPCREVTRAIANWPSHVPQCPPCPVRLYVTGLQECGAGYLSLVIEGHPVVSHASCSWKAGLVGTNAVSMGNLGHISPLIWPQFPLVASAGAVVQTVTAQVAL